MYKKQQNLLEQLYLTRLYFLKQGFFFFLLTANLLFCQDKIYQFDERMTTWPVKRARSSENNLLSLGNPRGWKKSYFWVRPLKTFPELHFMLSIKSLVTRRYFRGTLDKLIGWSNCNLLRTSLQLFQTLLTWLTAYRANSSVPKMEGIQELQDFIFMAPGKNKEKITITFLSLLYHKMTNSV